MGSVAKSGPSWTSFLSLVIKRENVSSHAKQYTPIAGLELYSSTNNFSFFHLCCMPIVVFHLKSILSHVPKMQKKILAAHVTSIISFICIFATLTSFLYVKTHVPHLHYLSTFIPLSGHDITLGQASFSSTWAEFNGLHFYAFTILFSGFI